MNEDDAQRYFLSRPEARLDFPFGPDAYVFKVRDKMFGLLGWRGEQARINVKCDPEQALMLRDIFPSVLPGYHMNKAHWNTVLLDGSVPTGEIERMIDLSYGLVVSKLKRAERTSLEVQHGKKLLYRGLALSQPK
jgi:predicted DNA-binding protein (MmcQ/YjbR family)